MPEGHTIHRLARDLRRDLAGQVVAVTSPQGRFSGGASQIDGFRLLSAEAYGKHLLIDFEPPALDGVLHIHLGLFGRFTRFADGAPSRSEKSSIANEVSGASSVRLRLAAAGWAWQLSGPTVCAFVNDQELRKLRDRLGPDPLRSNADPALFVASVRASRRAIGALLLDQSIVAGIGNVYRSELCYRLRLDPRTPGNELSADEVRWLWDDAVALLTIGVRLGRIVTVDAVGDRSTKGSGRRRNTVADLPAGKRVSVYRRDHCLGCGAEVERFDLGNRWAYVCPVEQPSQS